MATIHVSFDVDSSETGLLTKLADLLPGTDAPAVRPIAVPTEALQLSEAAMAAKVTASKELEEQQPAKRTRSRRKTSKPSGAIEDKPVEASAAAETAQADFAAPVGLPGAPAAVAAPTPAVAPPMQQAPVTAPGYAAIPMTTADGAPVGYMQAPVAAVQGAPTALPSAPGKAYSADEIKSAVGKLLIPPFNFSPEQVQQVILQPFGDGRAFDSIPEQNFPFVAAKLRELGVQGV